MSYLDIINHIGSDAEQLELAYQDAVQSGKTETFAQAIDATYVKEPDNLLYAAWHYRLQHVVARTKGRVIAWAWAIPLAVLNGLIFWLLTDFDRFELKIPGQPYGSIPLLLLYWMPIAAAFILIYLAAAGKQRWKRALALMAGMAAVGAYVYWRYPHLPGIVPAEQYLSLSAIHLPILALAAIGIYLLIGRNDPANRFAFLVKLLEAVVLAGIFVLVGGVFVGLTSGLFAAIDIDLPEWALRLLIGGGGGLIPVLAVAIVYDPARPPAEQSFTEGLSKIVALLMRLTLPLSLLVLLIYLGFIPFNFRAPFTNRDILIIYNLVLFAVMALLLGATPVRSDSLSSQQQQWLRWGIVAVALLAALVGLYALIAIGYRTWRGALTPNRMAFIGWNIINLGLLILLLAKQARASLSDWLPRLQSVFATGAVVYALWTLVVVSATPWLFLQQNPDFAGLPPSVQRAVYGGDYPILLKCYGSPHIYLLERGEKRWVKDIPTFEAEGFTWEDVRFTSCEELRKIPDGPSIPPDAGPPPVPVDRMGPMPTPPLIPPSRPTPTPAPS